ncbi:YdeI/OmpD-associated family protein [Myxococcus faecalis]|uniref:YdeI/OmpD-associated family protein n=1 Tax=Myxococcus faecalis TaxID=3115646 RepID=UPI003CEB5CB2
MSLAPTGGAGSSSAAAAAEAQRRAAEAARRAAEEARRAAEAARKAAEAARKAAEAARKAAEAARKQQAEAKKTAEAAKKAAEKPGQKPEDAKKTQADAAAAEKAKKAADEKAAAAAKKLQAAEEQVALSAKKAEEAMGKANTEAVKEKKPQPYSQKDIESVKPKKNELVSAFDGTARKGELEKLLGTTAPPPENSVKPVEGEKPPESLDALDAKDLQDATKLKDGEKYKDPSSGATYDVKKNALTGDTTLSDAKSGNTVTVKKDGSYTSTVTAKEKGKEGATGETTWTKTSDAQGKTTGLESKKSQTQQHPETGATTTSSMTKYDVSKSSPKIQSRTEEIRMEKPPASLANRPGTPKGPATQTTQTDYNEWGIPTKQVKKTEIKTPGFNADAVNGFEAAQNKALNDASKGEDHHKTNNSPTSLKPGESSLTVTEETKYNAKGEPAVSTQKTESVATQPLSSDKNGNGVQVVRNQQEVTRGPKDAVLTDSLPAVSQKTPGNVTSKTTVTGYDPDGSRFDEGHANRTQTVSQSSGTVDANGQLQMKHQPTEVKSLQEAGDNRWKYDHVGFDVDANGQVKKDQEPKELDKERQLPWYEDAKDFVTEGLGDLAGMAGDFAKDALGFAKDVVLKPIDMAIDQITAPIEGAVADEIKKLNSPGDTITLSGNLDVKVGLKAGIDGEVEVEKTADGKYQLSAEVTGDVGVGLVGSASVSAGGRVEMKFDTPEEAAKAAVILGKGPAALASGGEDHKFMLDHLSAMEVNIGAEAEAGLGGKFGPASAELSASIGATTSYRVEFDKGKPTNLVRSIEIEGSGAASIAGGLKGKAGINIGGEVTGSVSMETSIPLDASKVDAKDMLAFIASPATAAFAGPAETSLSIEGSVDAGPEGRFFTAEVSGLSGEEVQTITKNLVNGNFDNAFEGVKVDAQFTTGSFKDRELGVGAKLGVVDFEVNARHRDVTAEGGSGNGGTTVSLGGRRRNGTNGSDGSNGSNGSNGSDGTNGSNKPGSTTGTDSKPGTTTGTDSRPGTTTDTRPGTTTNPEQAGRPPQNRVENRPTEFRVNPATGQLIPVPRTNGPENTRPTQPEVGTDNTGRPPVPVVRNPELNGRTTQVRYDNGKVHIEAGPDATKEDIQAHMETARVLQRYEGTLGKVRQLVDKVKQAITGMPGYGTQGFESRLEVQKLNGILKSLEATQAQLNQAVNGATGKSTPATAAQLKDLEQRIASAERQLTEHAAQVDSLTSGRGYVAMKDDTSKPPEERIRAALENTPPRLYPPELREQFTQDPKFREFFTSMTPGEQQVALERLSTRRYTPDQLTTEMTRMRERLSQAAGPMSQDANPADRTPEQRAEVLRDFREVNGKAGIYQTYVSDSNLAANQAQVTAIRDNLNAFNPDSMIVVERGGAFLGDVLTHGDPGLADKTTTIQKAKGTQPYDKIRAELEQKIANGETRFAFVDAYMGGGFAKGLQKVLEDVSKAHPDKDLQFRVAWMREELGFEEQVPSIGSDDGRPTLRLPSSGLPDSGNISHLEFNVPLVIGDDAPALQDTRVPGQSIKIFDSEGRLKVVNPREGESTRELIIRVLNGEDS